jgi:hypothetical protein
MEDFSNTILPKKFESFHFIVNNHFIFQMKHLKSIINKKLKPELKALSLC